MTIQDFQQFLRARPFQPFRVYVSGGEIFDVRHPEMCMPGQHSVIIGLPMYGYSPPIFGNYTIVDLIHMIRLEPLSPLHSSNSNGTVA